MQKNPHVWCRAGLEKENFPLKLEPSNRFIPQNNTIVPSPGALGLEQWSGGIKLSC